MRDQLHRVIDALPIEDLKRVMVVAEIGSAPYVELTFARPVEQDPESTLEPVEEDKTFRSLSE